MNAHRSFEETHQHFAHRLELLRAVVAHANDHSHDNWFASGSEIDTEDSRLSYLRVGHLVRMLLNHSSDMLQTALFAISGDGSKVQIPLVGLYPLFRGAIESSAEAVWILSQDSPTERLRRALQISWEEICEEDRMARQLVGDPNRGSKTEVAHKQKMLRANTAEVRKRKNALRELAKKNQISRESFEKTFAGLGPLLASEADEIHLEPAMTRGVWHILSGFAHPSQHRIVRFSERTVMEIRDDGSDFVEVKPDLSLITMSLEAALLWRMRALELCAIRGANPALNVDFSGVRAPQMTGVSENDAERQ